MPAPEAPLPKTYDPHAVEERIYRMWEEAGAFRGDPDSPKPPFSIVIPPPNVTGSLHIGHALNNGLQDIIVRFMRMDGRNVLWVPGTDHAGIATQNVVERKIAREGFSREQLGRASFEQEVWKWKDEYDQRILDQLRRLGASCDWTRTRFTLDEGLSRAVREVFVRLHQEGLIYRGDYVINWCPRCKTALSDLEVEPKEILAQGGLVYVAYPLADGGGEVVVATTRPETLFGDTAVAVHPEDDRYRKFVGRAVRLPLTERQIPVVADSMVDREFGTGALKVTPAHDFNDFALGERHRLPRIQVIDETGRMTRQDEPGVAPFEGMDRFQARKPVVEALARAGVLRKQEDYRVLLGHCYRCAEPVEPLLSKQWFVRIAPLAPPAVEAVRSGRIRFVPKSWEHSYFDWMGRIRDWCISRQLWWGHRIPAWTCGACGATTVAADTPSACGSCGKGPLTQDPDVLDTWFSSALWPFSTLGWPEKTRDLAVYYPTNLLITSFDIIFFWVARMIMMGLKFTGDVPFRTVYIHALVRDAQRRKMSKSKGNVVDPLDILKEHGADALRFTLAALAAQGRDITLNPQRIEGYRHFVTKLWNAARFVMLHLEDVSAHTTKPPAPRALADRWILARLSQAIARVREALEGYAYDVAAGLLYQFVWHTFCDWYLEAAKPLLSTPEAGSTRATMGYVLETVLRLLHPFLPFVTEELWQKLPGPRPAPLLMLAPYPRPLEVRAFAEAAERMEEIQEVVRAVRTARSENRLPPQQALRAIVVVPDADRRRTLEAHRALVTSIGRIDPLEVVAERPEIPTATVSVTWPGMEVHVPLGEVLDFEGEERRVQKELKATEQALQSLEAKLASREFLAKAPEDVVEEKRAEQQELEAQRKHCLEFLGRLRSFQAGRRAPSA